MKHFIFTLVLILSFITLQAQRSTGVVISQGVINNTTPVNITSIDTTVAGNYNWRFSRFDSLKLKYWQMLWLNDTIVSIGNGRYAQLLGSYSNPNFIQSLSSSKVFGLSSVAISGDYNDLSSRPNLALKYDASNPSGFISGVTSGMITGALGYTPYPSSNPNNYQTKTIQATDGILKVSSATADTVKTDWTLVMAVSRATDSISALRTLINSKLSISDTTGKFKPSSYTPSSGEISTALGYTPYNGTTNPNGFLTTVSSGNVTSALGYTPTPNTRTITINGSTQDLSANRTWNVGTLVANDTLNLSSRINAKQDILSGTGFVKSTAGTISYDNTTYYPNSNPNGYTSNTGTVTNVTGTTNRISVTNGTTTPTIDIASNYVGQASITTVGTISSGTWNGTAISKVDTSLIGTKYQTDTMRTRLNSALNTLSSAGYITQSGARSALSAGTGISYNSTTGVITNSSPDQTVSIASGSGISVTGTYPNFTVASTATAPSFNNAPARSLNTSYQISTTNNARVSYSITCATGLALLNLNSTAQVFLEISPNNSTWTTIAGGGSTQTLAVAISVGINTTQIQNLQCEIPAGYWIRLRTVTSGGGSTSFSYGQEVIY